MLRFGIHYYSVDSDPGGFLEFIECDDLEEAVWRVKTNDFTGVLFLASGTESVPCVHILDNSGVCLCRIPVTDLECNSFSS